MDLKDLLSDSSKRTVDIAVGIVGKNANRFKLMLDFALEDQDRYAMRAARVINAVSSKYPELIRPHLPRLVDKIQGFKNNGLKRGILKTISERSLDYSDELMGNLVDTCFQLLNDSGEEIAIKIYALDILYHASFLYPEIVPELMEAIRLELPRASAGVRSKGKKMLVKLGENLV